MILHNMDEYIELSEGSHKIFNVHCDLEISEKCRGSYRKEFRTIMRDRNINDNKDVCLYCSRTIKFSGRQNPNCKYKGIDDNYLNNIDCEEKAYILGWIAGDGHLADNGSISIEIGTQDKPILEIIKRYFDDNLVVTIRDNRACLTINSTQIMKDARKHLNVQTSNKSNKIEFPILKNDKLNYAFIRGLFDSDGSVADPRVNKTKRYPKCDITTTSKHMLSKLDNIITIPHSISKDKIVFSGNNALDFMHKLYDSAKLYLPRKKHLYLDWALWIPAIGGTGSTGKEILFKWNRTRTDAIPPSKSRASDSGYDLVILEKVKQIGNVELWDTGIKILPEFGWYFDMVARSSIIKTGYMLAHSIGIIDRSYTGNIMVPIVKIDNNMPDMKTGTKLVQLVPRPIIHVEIEEVDEFNETERSSDGFGSTGR